VHGPVRAPPTGPCLAGSASSRDGGEAPELDSKALARRRGSPAGHAFGGRDLDVTKMGTPSAATPSVVPTRAVAAPGRLCPWGGRSRSQDPLLPSDSRRHALLEEGGGRRGGWLDVPAPA
jgi:hypothetical protein